MRSELPDLTDRYEVEATIGTGGMATVARARDRATGERVALKRLHEHLSGDRHFENILLDEARVQRLVVHPNVVVTLDVGIFHGRLALVLELVDGVPLSRWTSRDEVLAPGLALEIVCQILSGLGAAHAARDEEDRPLDLVHRDVSPQNVLVGRDGTVKLADFGIARARARLQTTSEGRIKGKLAYMSPEQIEGRALDARSDLFSTGVVLWELLTGARLFDGASEGEIVRRVLSLEVPAPSKVRGGAPPALDAIVMKSLARDPELRWPSALAMRDALSAAFGRAGARALGEAVPEPVSVVYVASPDVGALAPTIEAGAPSKGPARDGTQVLTREHARRRSRSPLIAPAFAVLAICGVALFAVTRARSPEGPAAAAPAATALAPAPETGAAPSTPPPAEPSAAAAPSSSMRRPPAVRSQPVRAPSAAPAAPSSAPPSCDPPYRVDERGVRVFRHECL